MQFIPSIRRLFAAKTSKLFGFRGATSQSFSLVGPTLWDRLYTATCLIATSCHNTHEIGAPQPDPRQYNAHEDHARGTLSVTRTSPIAISLSDQRQKTALRQLIACMSCDVPIHDASLNRSRSFLTEGICVNARFSSRLLYGTGIDM